MAENFDLANPPVDTWRDEQDRSEWFEEAASYWGARARALEHELNDVGAECSRLEADILDLHDQLEAAGLPGAINAESIRERIERLLEKPK